MKCWRSGDKHSSECITLHHSGSHLELLYVTLHTRVIGTCIPDVFSMTSYDQHMDNFVTGRGFVINYVFVASFYHDAERTERLCGDWEEKTKARVCARLYTHTSPCFLIFSFLPPLLISVQKDAPLFAVSQTLTINELACYKNSIWLGPKDSGPHTSQFLD